MTYKRFLFIVSGVFCCLLFCSCGYHMGSMMHPQVKTIAIADIRNDSKEPLLTPVMRAQLAEQFQFDGSLELTDKESADCVLYCRISKVDSRSVRDASSDGQLTYRPAEFRATIVCNFTVIIPGRSEALIPMREVSGSGDYQYETDSQLGRLAGLKIAAFNASRLIVQYTTEAW